MFIGELADASGVGVETVRFYEREGLLPEPPRTGGGYRVYDADAVRRVRFILRAKELGFTLAETKELLDLRVTDPAACGDVEATARAKITDIEARIQELERIRAVLGDLVRACAANEQTGECPILDALEDGSDTEWEE
ncbi:MAG: MerR family transcriptional regulator [Candidatus Longimicrobiales bacterium M2_2A_002]